MTWGTDIIVHGNQPNKRAHGFRKSFLACRPSKRHHIVLRKKSKFRTLDSFQKRYILHSSSSFTADRCTSEDEETRKDQGSFERNCCVRTPFRNKKDNLSSPCGSEKSPKIMHYQVDSSSESSAARPSSEDFTDPLHIHSINAEDEETGTEKYSIVRNTWGRTPFKNKKRILSTPQNESGPEIMHQVGRCSEVSKSLPFHEDFRESLHIHSANAISELGVNKVDLNSISICGCMDDCTETETKSLQPKATTTDLCHNVDSKCGDKSSVVGSEPCVQEADTRKATATTVSNFSTHDVRGTGPEACILKECTSISKIQSNCRDGSFSEKESKYVSNGKVGRYLERGCRTMQQYSCKRINSYSKKVSLIGFDVSGSLDTGVEQPSFNDVYVNVDVLRGVSTRQCDILPQDTTTLDFKSRRETVSSYTDTSSSAEASSSSGNTSMTRSHLCPANNSTQPQHRRHHCERPIRTHIFRRPRKILVLGDMMSGKSNLISAYCSDTYKEDYIPTIVRCLQTDAEVLGEMINLVVVEISGRDDFQPLRRYAYHKMDAAIICYPVNSLDSLERVRNYWVPELKKHSPKAPFVVVGTKRDIRDEARDRVEEHKQKLRGEEEEMAGRLSAESAFVKEFVSHDRGKRVSNDLGAAAFYECCSIYRDGTRKVFESVAKIALQKSRRKRKMSTRHDSMCTIL